MELSEKQLFICEKFQEIHFDLRNKKNDYIDDIKKIYKAIIYSIGPENTKRNPDWISQTSNSIRELFYQLPPFKHDKIDIGTSKKLISIGLEEERIKNQHTCIYNLYNIYQHLTHHRKEIGYLQIKTHFPFLIKNEECLDKNLFLKLFNFFEESILSYFINEIKIIKYLSNVLKKEKQINYQELKSTLELSLNGKNFFYLNASHKILEKLHSNKLLETLKAKQEINSRENIPESSYLARITPKKPNKVAEIISKYPAKQTSMWVIANYIQAFCNMPKSFPDSKMKILIEKIKKENWLKRYNPQETHMGYEYTRLAEKLLSERKYKSLHQLLDTIFEPAPAKEQNDSYNTKMILGNNYYSHLYNKINELPKNKSLEFAKLFRDKLSLIIKTKYQAEITRNKKSKIKKKDFDDDSDIWCSDIESAKLDWSVNFEQKEPIFICMRNLFLKYLNSIKDNKSNIKKVLNDFLKNQKTPIFKRFKIYIYNQYKSVFKEEIKEAIFNLKENDIRTYEYRKLVKDNIGKFSKKEQLGFYKELKTRLKREKEEDYTEIYISKIISSFDKNIQEEIKKEYKKIQPSSLEPSYKKGGIYSVGNVSPYSLEEINKMGVKKLVKEIINFKPSEEAEYKPDTPSISGFREKLKIYTKNNPKEISNNASLFKNPKILPGYIYAIFLGLKDSIRNSEHKDINWKQIFDLMDNILKRKDKSKEEYMISWGETHVALLWVIKELIDSNIDFKKYAKEIVLINKHFAKAGKYKESKEEVKNTDPHHIAINNKRGVAFQNLMIFSTKFNSKKLHEDIKKHLEYLFEKDRSFDLRYMFGRWSIWFNHFDEKWFSKNIDKIFIKGNSELKLASIEGFLGGNISKELFLKMRPLYEWTIDKIKKGIPNERKYSQDIEHKLANHLGIAFAYDFIDKNDDLIQKLLKLSPEKRGKFISFLGKGYILDKTDREGLPSDLKAKLLDLWDDRLKQKNNKKELKKFGWWVNMKFLGEEASLKRFKETLVKTEGEIESPLFLIEALNNCENEKNYQNIFDILEAIVKSSFKNKRHLFEVDKIYSIMNRIRNKIDKKRLENLVNLFLKYGFYQFKEIVE